MTARPTDEQKDRMRLGLLNHKFIDQVNGDFVPGLMGHQIDVHLKNVDADGFELYVEDVELNCEWNIVRLSSGRYDPDFPNKGLVATVEVRRFPEIPES